jgi:UDP-2,3-diacylglucosamine pyrophosphatase LpxH
VFVISDLHLGGRPHDPNKETQSGSQICTSYRELTEFTDWVAAQGTAKAPVELVVNGDIVDFLMEDNYGSAGGAVPWLPNEPKIIEKLKIIVQRTREGKTRGPFDAMASLLEAGHFLTFILGNHDVELSLPNVRQYLVDEVLQASTTGRFQFIYDGEAYVKGDLLIEHGNRYDKWNIVDHSALRQERSMLSRGMGKQMCERFEGHFIPPPGSVLVTTVINKIKRRYRFVDLLKPEGSALMPILLRLNPKLEYILSTILSYESARKNKFSSPAQPANSGQLGADEADDEFDLQASLYEALGEKAEELFDVEGGDVQPLGLKEGWESINQLSSNIKHWLEKAENAFTNEQSYPVMHTVFTMIRNWLTIDTTTEKADYKKAVHELANSGKFSCVVFGHTHLAKQITWPCTQGHEVTYINTGTWADIITIPLEALAKGASSKEFNGFMKDIESNNIDKYLTRYLSYAEIQLDGGKVTSAQLQTFNSIRPGDQ